MKKILASILIGLVCSSFNTFKNEGLRIKFIPVFGNSPLQLNTNYFLPALNDSVSIETLRFYVSKITLLNKGKQVYRPKNVFHLIDLETKTELNLPINRSLVFDAIQFDLGIDSVTNVSGAMGGDLDPTKGMYWAWQSGYINFKLEGASKSCKTLHHKFQYHIGGYQHPFNTLQTLVLPLRQQPEITLDIQQFLNTIDLKTMPEVMSPNAKAMQLAASLKTAFAIKP